MRNGGAAERVGLEDVGAGREILPMDIANHIGARQREHIAIALEIVPMIAEPVSAKVRFVQLDALAEQRLKTFDKGHLCFTPWGFGSAPRCRAYVCRVGPAKQTRRSWNPGLAWRPKR